MSTEGGQTQRMRAKSGQDKARFTRLESENQRLRDRVEELERDVAHLQDFAAMTAHEVLKPLVMNEACATAIRERIERRLDPASRQELDSIIHISTGARMMVEALLLEARDRRATLPSEPIDLTRVVRDCLAVLSPDIEAREASIEVDPLPVVRGNGALLGGVFGNLLANAVKYGPERGSRIRVTAARSEANWVFSVEGTGSAIPELERQSMFDSSRRRTAARSRGNGLGLAVVRRIVERHGGEVGVTSSDGSSNRFFFTLPD
jgi:signal transduction histidine kinase